MSHALRLDALPDQLPPHRAAQWLLGLIASFTLLMLVWAGLARVPETAIAAGRVVPQRQLQLVSNLEGGTVAAILARPGQKVAAGETLIRLDPALAAGDYGRSSATTQALRARIARLEAEVSGGLPAFPAGLSQSAPAAVAAEQALWSAHATEVRALSAGENARIEAASRALSEAAAESASRAEARAQAAREVSVLAPLVAKDIEPAISLDRARSTLAQARSSEAAAAAALARARAALAEARAGSLSALGRLRSQSADALALARAELASQSAALPALQGRLDRTAVRSPIAGTVQRIMVNTIGGFVAPGAPLVEIVPTGDRLVVEARVRPADIAFVHTGQTARVKLSAYDSSVYGALDGKVTRISPDAIVDDRSGESHYAVNIETRSASLIAPDGSRLPVAPGMIAQVDLVGRQRSVLSYLLNPVTKLTENAFRER